MLNNSYPITMKRTFQSFTILLFSVCSITAFADIHANASNPLLTEYLQQSQKVNESTVAAKAPETSILIKEIYNYACSPKLEECTVYDFIDE